MMETEPLIRQTFAVGQLGCNCTILADRASAQAIIIDPGDDAVGILARVTAGGFSVTAVLHTHAHIDHVGATAGVCSATGAPGMLHPDDAPLYQALSVQAMMLGLGTPPPSWEMVDIKDGQSFRLGDVDVGVMHTPGHTMGSCSFLLERAGLVFTGDTLFNRGVGRTDLGGDWDMLVGSIRQRLFPLPEETVVVPGHGPVTTVGEERHGNPFVQAD